MSENYSDLDVIIVGGGPGGLSAALWCADLGLRSVLFEKETELGGQLLWTFNAIKNYLGIEARNGRELRDRFLEHLKNKQLALATGTIVVSSDLVRKTVTLAGGEQVSAKAIIIATGVRRKRLDVPGEDEFQGRGILRSGVESRDEIAGKTVVIVGGGDAALENAMILSEKAGKVIVVHRRDTFKAREQFVDRVSRLSNIQILFKNRVTAVRGEDWVKAVEILNEFSGSRSVVAADALLVRIGVEANTELFMGQAAMDESGYLITDRSCMTDLTSVYAVGDAASPESPTIAGAVGQGSTAAKFIASRAIG